MARLGGDFDQGFQNKPSLVHGWMGNLQAGLIEDAISEKHYVDIDVARTIFAQAKTSHGGFDLQRELEQFPRRFPGFDGGYTIQKPGQVRDVGRNVDRLGFVQRGDGQQPSGRAQLRKGRAQVGVAVSQIRSQR